MQQLESQEFFQLECQEKLAVLRGLCLRVMATYSVQDYMEEKQREAIQLTYVLGGGWGWGVEWPPTLCRTTGRRNSTKPPSSSTF